MRGSVWILIACYLTNRRGTVFAREKVYGFSEVRQISTIEQQKLQYNKALNKALATYRSNNNLDSDTEVGFTHLNDGITYEGSKNGVKQIKRKKTKLTGANKREVRIEVLQNQKAKGESGKTVTKEELKKMYDKKITEREYNKLNKLNKHSRKVKVVRKNVRGYYGLNRPASRELGLKTQPKDNEVYVDSHLKGRKYRQVVYHEKKERALMNKGMPYNKAHKKALKGEKKIK